MLTKLADRALLISREFRVGVVGLAWVPEDLSLGVWDVNLEEALSDPPSKL